MNAQRAPSPFCQHLKVAASLRRLDHAEAVGMAWHANVGGIVTGDLQKHAGIRTTLEDLSGRVLEARPETDAGCRAGVVADTRAQPGQRLLALGIALDIREERHVIAVPVAAM